VWELFRKNHHTPYIYNVTANRLDEEVQIMKEKLREQTNKSRQAVLMFRRADYLIYYDTFLLLEEDKSQQSREHLKSD